MRPEKERVVFTTASRCGDWRSHFKPLLHNALFIKSFIVCAIHPRPVITGVSDSDRLDADAIVNAPPPARAAGGGGTWQTRSLVKLFSSCSHHNRISDSSDAPTFARWCSAQMHIHSSLRFGSPRCGGTWKLESMDPSDGERTCATSRRVVLPLC